MPDYSHEMVGDQQKIDSALRAVIADPAFIEKQKDIKTTKDLILNETEAGQVVLNRNGLVVIRPTGTDHTETMVFKLLKVGGDYPELGGKLTSMFRYTRKADDEPFIDDDMAFVMVEGGSFWQKGETSWVEKNTVGSQEGKTLLRKFYDSEYFKGLTAEKIMQVKQEYLAS